MLYKELAAKGYKIQPLGETDKVIGELAAKDQFFKYKGLYGIFDKQAIQRDVKLTFLFMEHMKNFIPGLSRI